MRHKSYHLVKVPSPHGRLIDADALIDDLRHSLFGYARMNGHFRDECNCLILIEMLERAETVCAADSEKLKELKEYIECGKD